MEKIVWTTKITSRERERYLPRKIVTVVRKRASILGWSVIAPDTILPPVLKNPIREIRSADSSSVRPLC